METGLKALVAAACAVIILGVGYFVWRDHQDRSEAARIAEMRVQQAVCDLMLSEFQSGKYTIDWRILHVVNCIENGNLSEDDFSTPELRAHLDEARPFITPKKK